MKRPFAVIGFSMLLTSLIVMNIKFKTTVALLFGVTVALLIFLGFKNLRKQKFIIFTLFAALIYILSSIFAQYVYCNALEEIKNETEITGVVCNTPQKTDYAFIYIIKPVNKSYKIRYVSENDKMFHQGDIVTGIIMNGDENYKDDFLENSLSSKIYFTFFEEDENFLDKTGEYNAFFRNIGKTKDWFSNKIDKYIPGESGGIAKAMTIGDKSEIGRNTSDNFNYSGTAHLLVISGLHLTLWSIGLLKFLEKFSKLRKYMVPIAISGLFLYSALTGFSVSVLRAGAMIGAVIFGKAIHRDADSINSIGLALAFILTVNPFASLSAGLWFSVLSTLGILVFAQKIILIFKERTRNNKSLRNGVVFAFVSTAVISVSTTIFTLPVFIAKFKILPIASVISNIVMIDLALLLIILTVAGCIIDSFGLVFLSESVFTITGAISNFLKVFAKKIGLAEWSTVSISHEYYKYFLAFSLVCIVVVWALKKYRKFLIKPVAVMMSITFILLSLYCANKDYETLWVDVLFTESTPAVTVIYKGTSVLVNPPGEKYVFELKEMLNSHNKKNIDTLFVTKNTEETASQIINLYSNFNVENAAFCNKAPQLFEDDAISNVKSVTVGGNVKINTENSSQYTEILYREKRLIIIEGETAEKHFKNIKDYDIIILYGKNACDVKENIEIQNQNASVLLAEDMQKYTIHLK